jgi:hypothetical protein
MSEPGLKFVLPDGAVAKVPAEQARLIADRLWELALASERGALTASLRISEALRSTPAVGREVEFDPAEARLLEKVGEGAVQWVIPPSVAPGDVCIAIPPLTLERMPERLDRVIVKYSRGEVILPWSSRDALLEEVRQLDSAAGVRRAFEAVGASAPVHLSRDDAGLIVEAVDVWMRNVGRDGLPAGVFDLRNALLDDLHDEAPS